MFLISFKSNAYSAMQSSWVCTNIDDLGEDKSHHIQCEKCHHAQIRYVHTMENEAEHKTLKVGSTCATNMDTKAREREENLKKKKQAVNKRWEKVSIPNQDMTFLSFGKKGHSNYVCLSAFKEEDGKYNYSIDEKGPSQKAFNTMEEAQKAAIIAAKTAIDALWPLYLKQ
jgi:hypothetical protein